MQSERNLFSTQYTLKHCVLFFLAALLSLQLCALTQHHHDLNAKVDNCAACQLANNLTGDPPAIPGVVLFATLFLAYHLIQPQHRSSFLLLQRLPCPRSQAPPTI